MHKDQTSQSCSSNQLSINHRPQTLRKWKGLIKGFSESSFTPSSFCRSKGITLSSFYTWRSYFREHAEVETPTFIPLKIQSPLPPEEPRSVPSSSPPETLEPPSTSQRIVSQHVSVPDDTTPNSLVLHLRADLRLSVPADFHAPTLKRLLQTLETINEVSCL
jgi:hypothetical protein